MSVLPRYWKVDRGGFAWENTKKNSGESWNVIYINYIDNNTTYAWQNIQSFWLKQDRPFCFWIIFNK